MARPSSNSLAAAASRHALPAALFVVLACAWSYPLVLHLGTAIPGAGAGDNVTFVWNVWWMRHVLASPADSFFFTRYLFAPFGVDLTLHTHTALLDLVGATVLGRIPLLTAFNLLVLGSLFLNAVAAYALSCLVTRDRAAATLAGVVFGGSPFVMAHLHGHLNLVAAWGLPLFAACLFRTLKDRSRGWSACAGLLLACLAYSDYYYLIYACVFALIYTAGTWFTWSLDWVKRQPLRRWPIYAVLAVLAADLALAAGIGLTGGWVVAFAGTHVSMTRPTNVLTFAWVLLALLVAMHWRPVVGVQREPGSLRREALLMLPLAIVAVVGAVPLAINGLHLWQGGDYVSPTYLWRSSSPGIDLLALAAGNQFHPIWGGVTRAIFARSGMNLIEGAGWLGVVPTVLLWIAARRHRQWDAEARRWWVIGGVFLLWALGPFLIVGGMNTGLFLPAFLLRYVPVVANARIPGRAMIVVYLALAMMASKVLAEVGGSPRRRVALSSVAAALVLFDFLAVPFPLYRPDVPTLYEFLRDRPATGTGAVCELPVGIRDGFGEAGYLDPAVLYYQTEHGHPLIGGFVARLSPRVRASYESDQALGALLRLSAGEPIGRLRLEAGAPARIEQGLHRLGVGYLVLNRAIAPPDLVALVDAMPGLRRLVREGPRDLFALGPAT